MSVIVKIIRKEFVQLTSSDIIFKLFIFYRNHLHSTTSQDSFSEEKKNAMEWVIPILDEGNLIFFFAIDLIESKFTNKETRPKMMKLKILNKHVFDLASIYNHRYRLISAVLFCRLKHIDITEFTPLDNLMFFANPQLNDIQFLHNFIEKRILATFDIPEEQNSTTVRTTSKIKSLFIEKKMVILACINGIY